MNAPDHIDRGLNALETTFQKQSPGKLAVYAQVLRRKRISETEMADAVSACIEDCERFPSVKTLLAHARTAGANHPAASPIWDKPKASPLEEARQRRAVLLGTLSAYERMGRPAFTIAAVERDIAYLDGQITDRERLAMETLGMAENEAGAYLVEAHGGARYFPNALAALRAGPEERRLRGPETWTGQV